MELQNIFKSSYVSTLMLGVKDNSLIKYYESDVFLFDEQMILQSPSITLTQNSNLILPDKKSYYDFENSKIIYSLYKDLSPLQASDIRFWIYLAHSNYYPYMCKRWPGIQDKSAINKSKYILDHWFITSPSQSNFLRHGIAGLWWAAHLTYDEKREDPFELTQIVFRNLDFGFRTLGTYKLGRHKEAIIGIAEFIIEHPDVFEGKFQQKSRYLVKYLNQLGGTKPLSYFNRYYFKTALMDVKEKIKSLA